MATDLAITVECAKGLKDDDWIGKQDPYVALKLGAQTFKSKTCQNGGSNPTWNETFQAKITNETVLEITIHDEDSSRSDEVVGTATISLAKVLESGSDKVEAPVVRKAGEQKGTIVISLKHTNPHKPVAAAAAAADKPGHKRSGSSSSSSSSDEEGK